jgi:hypothetical protein
MRSNHEVARRLQAMRLFRARADEHDLALVEDLETSIEALEWVLETPAKHTNGTAPQGGEHGDA